LSADPTAGNSEKFRAGLTEIVENLEEHIKETLNTPSKDPLGPRDKENAYQSVSEAMGNYVASSDAVHWSRWKEEKF
jgi:hypothetical protein